MLHLLWICLSAIYISYTTEFQTLCHVNISSYNARNAVRLDYFMLHLNCMAPSNVHSNVHSADSSNNLPDHHATRTSACEVHPSVITERQPECLNKLLQRGHQGGHWRKHQIKDVSNLVYICPIHPIQVFKAHGFFCLCLSKNIFVGVQSLGTPVLFTY